MTATVPGYDYGAEAIPRSPVSLAELGALKQAAGMTAEDTAHLRRAGEILRDQTEAVVGAWREVIAATPFLAGYYASADGVIDDTYRVRVKERFKQWILDLCFRDFDQSWLDYQHEIGRRHTHLGKNQVDAADSVPHIHLRYLIAFTAVINERVKPFLARGAASAEELDLLHGAWCKAVLLTVALWSRPYTSDTAW